MFYVLDKSGRIVGSADGPVDAKDLAARGEVAVLSKLALPIDQVDVVGDPAQPYLVAKQVAVLPQIILSTNASDDDGDGLAELPADGESQAEITATLQDGSGEAITDPVEIQFRTSAGALSARSAISKKGKASVSLTSSRDTVMASVYVAATGFERANIEFEFLPVDKSTAKPPKK